MLHPLVSVGKFLLSWVNQPIKKFWNFFKTELGKLQIISLFVFKAIYFMMLNISMMHVVGLETFSNSLVYQDYQNEWKAI